MEQDQIWLVRLVANSEGACGDGLDDRYRDGVTVRYEGSGAPAAAELVALACEKWEVEAYPGEQYEMSPIELVVFHTVPERDTGCFACGRLTCDDDCYD